MKNKKRLSAIVFLSCVLFMSNTQAQNWDWAQSAGGKEVDYATGIVNDVNGNVYVIGSFNGTATFGDKQLTSTSYYDIFIAKYSPTGKLIWVSQAGGSAADEANGITLGADNKIYLTGYFSGSTNFGSINLVSKGDRAFFVAKYDMDGNPVWVQSGGGEQSGFGKAIASDNKGNLFVTGIFNSNATFKNTVLKSKGEEDIFVANYTTDGDLRWIKRIGGNGRDEATSIAADVNGNTYITGWFSGMADFGKINLTSDGNDDIFTAKYNSKGEEVWAKQGGGYNGVDRSYGIKVDAQGNTYVTGSFIGTAKFESTSLKSVGTDDCFLVKYNSDGMLQWVKQTSGKNGEIGRAISLDASGNIFVCGDYNSTFVTNPTQSTAGDWDVFVIKYDSKGNAVGANRAGCEGYDRPIAMSIDKNNNCYITGVYEKTCNFGKQQLTNQGNSDIFIAKTKAFDPVQ